MNSTTTQDLRDAQINAYIEMVKQGAPLLYLVSDSVSTSKVKPFADLFPLRLVNVGIAEQNLMGIAAGLANGGFIPITGNAAPFLISRSNEQLKVDINYSNSNVKVCAMHAGFSYGPDGITHHEINDISVMRGMPNFEIFCPCDPAESAQIAAYSVLHKKGPVYTSLNTGKFPVITSDTYKFTPGIPVQFSEGNDVTIIALGSAVHDVLDAVNLLRISGHSIKADIFSLSSIRPLQPETLISSIKKTGKAVTVEQHSTHGGAGSIIAELIADNGLSSKLKRKGVPEGSFSINQAQSYNKTFFSLDAAGIQKTIIDFLF